MRARWAEHILSVHPSLLLGRITYALSLYRLSLVIFGCLGGGSFVGSGYGGRIRLEDTRQTIYPGCHADGVATFLWLCAARMAAFGHKMLVVGSGEKSEEDPHARILDCITPLNTLPPVLFCTILLCTIQLASASVLLQPIYSLARPGHCCSILIESHFLLSSGAGGSAPARIPTTSTSLDFTIQLTAYSTPSAHRIQLALPFVRNPSASPQPVSALRVLLSVPSIVK